MRSSAKLLDQVILDLNDTDDSKLCPEPDKWFEFARLTPLDRVKIVIVGQDPYHTKIKGVCSAHGLAFSSLTGIPPSLRNIYACLENTGLIKSQASITTGNLTQWATQGVLMLNMALSTELALPNEHKDIWKSYTNFIIQRLCDYTYNKADQLIFFLWGRNAQSVASLIDEDVHVIKTWAHPSPLAQASLSPADKFTNCDCFTTANDQLAEWGYDPIDWNILTEPDSDSDIDELIMKVPERLPSEPPVPAPPEDAKPSKVNGKAGKNAGKNAGKEAGKEAKMAEEPKPVLAKLDAKIEQALARLGGPPAKLANATKRPPDTTWFNGHAKKIVVFTDGSCKPNRKSPKDRGGFAGVFSQGPFRDLTIYGSLAVNPHFATNIRAEGQAIISVLEVIGSDKLIDAWTECVIVTDSEFWINMITKYMPMWSEEKFKQKENYDMTSKLWSLWKTLMCTRELSLHHTYSHNKSGWKSAAEGTFERYCYDQNDYVDQMCGYARTALNPGELSVTEVEYE